MDIVFSIIATGGIKNEKKTYCNIFDRGYHGTE